MLNHVFTCENAKDLWKTISENYKGTKDVANEKYHVLIDKFNSFKQLDHENAETMYSRLNSFRDVSRYMGCEESTALVSVTRRLLE